MILLDTNVISELMRPQPEPRVVAWVDRLTRNNVGITAITVAEILYGIGALPDAQIAAICLANHAGLATQNTKDFANTDVTLHNPWVDELPQEAM